MLASQFFLEATLTQEMFPDNLDRVPYDMAVFMVLGGLGGGDNAKSLPTPNCF